MKDLAVNRKARFDYEILEEVEAGIELFGFEVKAIRAGKAHLAGGKAIIRGGEVYLLGLTIEPYQVKNTPENYDSERVRKLLLKRSQIRRMAGLAQTSNLTFMPLKVYSKQGKIKVLVGFAKRRTKGDKRSVIREREVKTSVSRSLKYRMR